jgi:hypothetical protein
MKLLPEQIIASPMIEHSEKAVQRDAGEITYHVIDRETFSPHLPASGCRTQRTGRG